MTRERRGISAQEWAEMVARAADLLEQTARARRTVTYGDLAVVAGGGRIAARSPLLMRLLGDAIDVLPAHDVILASLVVRANTGMPGDGYFAWAADHGYDTTDKAAMWRAQAERVWDAYAS